MSKQPLPKDKVELLRQQGIIKNEEVVFCMGDLFIAEHAITGEKRVINPNQFLTESPRRILVD